MKIDPASRLQPWGGVTLLLGVGMAASFLPLLALPDLRGPQVPVTLACLLLAGVLYAAAVARLGRDRIPLQLLWGCAVVFRLILFFTTPTLSDDVYRYIWDGHLLNQGASPYAAPVEATELDPYSIPVREQVNHAWMASPYPPAAQVYFALVTRLAPQNPKAFQLAALLLDLATGWLVMRLLARLGLPRGAVLIYLWNPLVVVEFAHGAHVDALMLLAMVAALYFALQIKPGGLYRGVYVVTSALSLGAAVLSKLLAGLLAPLLLRRWRWTGLLLFAGGLAGSWALFALDAGWGLTGPLDGRGAFGALRIYQRYWNFNGGLYHWLEVWLTGYATPGAVPVEAVGDEVIILVRGLSAAGTGLITLATAALAWRLDDPRRGEADRRGRALVRLSLLPLIAYLLLAPTVHPWYVTIIVPLLPFLMPAQGERGTLARFIWPGVYFSLAVLLSYLTYLDPNNLREFASVRLIEYLPLYLLLLWAAWQPVRQRILMRS